MHIHLVPNPDLPAIGQAWEVHMKIQSHFLRRLTRGGFYWSAANIVPSPNSPEPVDKQRPGHPHCWGWKLLEHPGKKAEESNWSASIMLYTANVDTPRVFRLQQLCRDNIRVVWGGPSKYRGMWSTQYKKAKPEKYNKHRWWFCPEYQLMKPAAPLYDDGRNKEEENRGGGNMDVDSKDEEMRDDDDDDLVSEIDHMIEGFVML
ncbi:hypothetical protein QBC37DRAFT_416398 [Rhypophila decipiens]|uniref:Uncharacterized protein n=1 Tax=Rhypophila decipiens TaxID=261697 RepID=A0AAN7BAM0_9PEZI|nr:hypothetical protein QBC37DRAFT_416398 [Rhypophila decipiens]